MLDHSAQVNRARLREHRGDQYDTPPEAVRALLDLAALDLPQAKRLAEKDHWDLSLIDEIQGSGFLDQRTRQ